MIADGARRGATSLGFSKNVLRLLARSVDHIVRDTAATKLGGALEEQITIPVQWKDEADQSRFAAFRHHSIIA